MGLFSYYFSLSGRFITAFLTGFAAGSFLVNIAGRMILIRTGINGSCFHSINENNNKKAVWLIAAGSSILFTLNEADGRLFFSWLFFCLLFLSAYVDYRLLIIPNEIITAKLFLWGLYSLFYIRPPLKIVQVIAGAVLFSGGILLLVVLLEKWKKRQMLGRGDIKLLFTIALFLGYERALYVLALACICGLGQIALDRKGKGGQIPFGPCIAFSAFLMML